MVVVRLVNFSSSIHDITTISHHRSWELETLTRSIALSFLRVGFRFHGRICSRTSENRFRWRPEGRDSPAKIPEETRQRKKQRGFSVSEATRWRSATEQRSRVSNNILISFFRQNSGNWIYRVATATRSIEIVRSVTKFVLYFSIRICRNMYFSSI